MNAHRPTGLGEPELKGKLSLFRPPDSTERRDKLESKTRAMTKDPMTIRLNVCVPR